MITGKVKSDEGRIRLTVKGPRHGEQEVEAVVDTGFTASLSLPPALVLALGLRWQTFDRGVLADGSEVFFDVYEATVVWDGKERRVMIDAADTDPPGGHVSLARPRIENGNPLSRQGQDQAFATEIAKLVSARLSRHSLHPPGTFCTLEGNPPAEPACPIEVPSA